MKKILTLLFATALLSFSSFAQEDDDDKGLLKYELPPRHKMVGLNMTPLMVQMIPFNRSNPNITGPYSLNYRSFRGNSAFRFGLGAFLNNNFFNSAQTSPHFNMRIGWERRKSFYKRWAYSFGLDFFASGGGFNIQGGNNNEDESSVGMGFVWGTEYFINPKVSLSVESQFLVGFLTFEGPTMVFIPPVALYLNFVVPKRKRYRRKRKE